MPDAPIKVAILSPHPVLVEGFAAMLGRHADRTEVVQMPATVGGDEPDVVLYDVITLLDDTDEVLDRMVKARACAIVAVERALRPDLLARAHLHGVDLFVALDVQPDDLVEAIEKAAAGAEHVDCADQAGPNGGSSIAQLLGADVALTEREAWVLGLIAQGLSNDEIARAGYLSINTVKTYVRSAYRKIGVRSRSQAVAWALHRGLPSVAGVPRS